MPGECERESTVQFSRRNVSRGLALQVAAAAAAVAGPMQPLRKPLSWVKSNTAGSRLPVCPGAELTPAPGGDAFPRHWSPRGFHGTWAALCRLSAANANEMKNFSPERKNGAMGGQYQQPKE